MNADSVSQLGRLELLLDRTCRLDGFRGAVEHRKNGIAGGVDDASLVGGDLGSERRAAGIQGRQRPPLVGGAGQTAIFEGIIQYLQSPDDLEEILANVEASRER